MRFREFESLYFLVIIHITFNYFLDSLDWFKLFACNALSDIYKILIEQAL